MNEPAHEYTIDLVVIECGCCHMSFGVPRVFYLDCRDEGAPFRCPNPKCGWKEQHYTTSDNQRLKAELERKERSLRWARNEANLAKRQRAAYKGQVTRIKKRVGSGVCPCCNRTFENLGRHMASKHPEYGGDE